MEPAPGSDFCGPVTPPHAGALLVALVLAPGTFPRNKFFELYKNEELLIARRRARMIRSLVKELTEPWPFPKSASHRSEPVIEQQEVRDELFYLRYRVEERCYQRSAILTLLEAATLRYALHRAGKGELLIEDKRLVESELAKLHPSKL
jgi:hypothetical protein